MNSVFLVGRLTRDPELRTISTGSATCSFSVAVNRLPGPNGEREADFINCVVWNKQAENLARFCTKGSLIGVQGRIQTRNYDGQDGKRVYVTEVLAQNITFLSSKNENSAGGYQSAPSYQNYSEPSTNPIETTDIAEDPFKEFGSEVVLSDDDLPF